jgi:hypothetical protein
MLSLPKLHLVEFGNGGGVLKGGFDSNITKVVLFSKSDGDRCLYRAAAKAASATSEQA